MKESCYHRVTNVFPSVFSDIMYYEACCGGAKKWDAMFLCRSLLLSTIVLNDSYIYRSLDILIIDTYLSSS